MYQCDHVKCFKLNKLNLFKGCFHKQLAKVILRNLLVLLI